MTSGSFEVTSHNKPEVTVRISWSESFDKETGLSNISITNIEMKNSYWYGFTYYLNGFIKAEDEEIKSFSSGSGEYSIRTDKLDTYNSLSNNDPDKYESLPWSISVPNSMGMCCFSGEIGGFIAGQTSGNSHGWKVEFNITEAITEPSFTITYDANGGYGAPEPQQMIPWEGGAIISEITPVKDPETWVSATVTFHDPTGDIIKTAMNAIEYDFGWWNTERDGFGLTYYPGERCDESRDIVLYAQYVTADMISESITAPRATEKVSKGIYQIKFDATGGQCSQASVTVEGITTYRGQYWARSDDSSFSKVCANGQKFLPEENMELVPVYKRSTECESILLPTPTREDYTFLGWSATPDGSEVFTGNYTPNGTITLYAIWQTNESLHPELSRGLSIKRNGEWKAADLLTKINGHWDTNVGVYIKVNGHWILK